MKLPAFRVQVPIWKGVGRVRTEGLAKPSEEPGVARAQPQWAESGQGRQWTGPGSGRRGGSQGVTVSMAERDTSSSGPSVFRVTRGAELECSEVSRPSISNNSCQVSKRNVCQSLGLKGRAGV